LERPNTLPVELGRRQLEVELDAEVKACVHRRRHARAVDGD